MWPINGIPDSRILELACGSVDLSVLTLGGATWNFRLTNLAKETLSVIPGRLTVELEQVPLEILINKPSEELGRKEYLLVPGEMIGFSFRCNDCTDRSRLILFGEKVLARGKDSCSIDTLILDRMSARSQHP